MATIVGCLLGIDFLLVSSKNKFCAWYASVFPIFNSACFVSSVIELPTAKSINLPGLLVLIDELLDGT